MSVIMPLRASGSLKWKHICFHVLLVLALTVFKQAGSQVKIYHNHFALHIPNGPDEAESIAQKHGFINRGQIGNVENHFLFEHHSIRPRWTNYSLDHHETLRQEPGVRWFEQQHEKRRVKRDFHTLNMPDPMFKDQWFLNHGAIDGSDMNVQPAWMKGYTGKRVVVTILDDGIQSNHPDLQLNYDPLASTDINGNDDDPMPQDNNDNKHGTRCAGEVAAEAFNNICGVGVAYNASIGGVRMLDGLVNDAVEARALSLRPDHIDIYSASWGPEDDGKTVDGPGPLAKKAFINGVKYGRNGKGSIFVWASGNGGRRVDNCNCDGYTNSIFTLSISSASQGGKKPWYLEECSSTLATTYSSGTPGHDASIVTVDQDAKLRPDKICTASHTGTSASAPIAAGVCALALEANPNLTWRDMQHIVVLTSNPNPLMVESGWKTNAVGRKYSHKFGYGLMDANAMVEVAKVWPGSGPLAICETDTITLDQPIPSDPSRVARASMKTNACGQTSSEIRYLEHVQCKLSLHYHPRGALQIVLTSPSGTKSSLLLPRPRDTTNAGFEDWPFLSVHFWGEPANGTWTIEVNHSPSVKGTGQSKGVLKKWKMLFYGTRESPLKDPSLVSEFGSFLGEDPNLDSEMMDEPVDVSGNNGQHTSWSSGSLSSYPYLLNHSNLLDAKEPLNQYDVSSSSSEVDLSSKSRSCHPQCKDNQCSGPKPTECLACKNFKFGNVCVDRCPLTTYSSIRGTCQACHPSCQTCFGPNPNDCLSCGNSLFLLTNQSTCIKGSCPLGYRQRPSSNECVPCPSHCESCTEASEVHNLIESPRTLYKHPQETSVVCLKCQPGLVRSVLENKCMSSCPGGFYLNQETRACDPCHESCATCIGSLPTQCSLCQDHTFYFERKCVEKCPIGFRPDVNRQECVPCPQGCGKCTSDQKCIKCKEEWIFAHGEQVCIPEIGVLCGKGSFRADENVDCEPCGSNCRSCAETKENCLTCPMNQALHLFTCIDHECPRGTFHDEKMRECRPCPHVCTECKSFDHCTNCHLGHALNAQGRCVTSCKPNEYQTSEQLCRPCHESCSTCQGPTDKDCLSCPESNKYLSSIGQCLEQCSRGFVDEKGQCQACHPSCASCHGPSPFQCSTCPSGRKLGPDGTCQSCEPRKFYDGHSNDCLLCHESCGTCSGPQDSDCLSCHVPLVLDTWNGTCVPCCQSLDERHCCTCSPSKEKCLKPSKKILSRKRSSVGISLSDEVLSNPSRSVFLYGTLLTTMVVMSLLVVRYFKRGKLLGRPSLNGVGRRRPRRRRQSSQDLSRTNYQKLLTEEDLAGGINGNRHLSKSLHTHSVSDLDHSDDDLDQTNDLYDLGNGNSESVPLCHLKT